MGASLIHHIRIRCDWETDNAGCANFVEPTVVAAQLGGSENTLQEQVEQLSRILAFHNWLVIGDVGEEKFYCPDCRKDVA